MTIAAPDGYRARSGALLAGSALWLSQAGYFALLLLCAALPFEVTQRPLLRTGLITLTDVSALFYLTGALAAFALLHAWTAGRFEPRRQHIFFAGLIGVALLSSVHSAHRLNGIKWTFDLALGGVIWQAIPSWLAEDRLARSRALASALVAGATLSAIAGLLEVAIGPTLDAGVLSVFKAKPTVIGPYLRLSGTFDYANTAGGYFAGVVPFALALAVSARRSRIRGPIAFGCLAVIAAALSLTLSRGALFGAAAGLTVLTLALRHTWPRLHVTPLRLGITVIVALALLAGGFAILSRSGPSTLRLTTQSDLEWYRDTAHGSLPSAPRPDSLLSVSISLRNPGPLMWRARGANPFHLSYHWLLPDGRLLVLDGLRTGLPRDLGPGQTVRLSARVLTPPRPGAYQFAWDLVEENIAWFGLHTGILARQSISVTGPSGDSSLTQPLLSPPIPAPTAPEQPERSVLWAAALRMIRAHPLLGVGPDGYRLSYGLYERPVQTHWDTRIYANSLPLEIGADIGLIGLALFLAVLACALGPGLVRTLRRGRTDLWTAAVLAAPAVLLAHGTVDYLLESRGVLLLFWISLGLVASLRKHTRPVHASA